MRSVPGFGPFSSPVLWVGEGPGTTETKLGRPFEGRVGQDVRRLMRQAGLDPEQVRWNNAIPHNINMPKEPAGMARVVQYYWDHLREDLESMRPRVIVACGRAALYRLTGKYKIMDETGGVWPTGQVVPPGPGGLPPGAVVIACLHPASVMRTKVGAGWLRVYRAVEKAARYADGQEYVERIAGLDLDLKVTRLRGWDDELLDEKLSSARKVAIDTEFDMQTGVPFLVGLSVDGREVLSFAPQGKLVEVLKKHMLRRDLLKIAHYHVADTGALARIGIDTVAPWWDTLEGFSHLYPDLPVGLAHVGLYYQLGYHNHKGMEHADPDYNAVDVGLAWHAQEQEEREMSEAHPKMIDVFMRERMVVAATFGMMADRGLKIDQTVRRARIEKSLQHEQELLGLIAAEAQATFDRRSLVAAGEVEVLAAEIAKVEQKHEKTLWQRCEYPKHEGYTGLKKKKFSSAEACKCRGIYELEVAKVAREEIAALRKQATALKGKIKRWLPGFNPGNNDHVRWLLYDKNALGLRRQYKNKKLTANADAINKLATLKSTQDVPGALDLLNRIKEVQHLRKWRSTFYFATPKNEAKIDMHGIVRPPLRAFGTGTGRPAGGADEATDAKKPNPYAFNIMNVPDECRGIYVPHTEEDLQRMGALQVWTKEDVEALVDGDEDEEEESDES